MGSPSSPQYFFKKYWDGYRDFWSERFSFLSNYSKFVKRDKPLPPWSESDVEAFIAFDPVHGPAVISKPSLLLFPSFYSALSACKFLCL